jgi:hypothetical protein
VLGHEATKRLAMSVIDEPWLPLPVLETVLHCATATSSRGVASFSAGSCSAVRTALTRQSVAAWNCVSEAASGPRIK